MSLKDDILNQLDDPKAFTNKVSKLVHLPTSVVKSLTEPLGLKDYMNLAKAVDEQDPESAKHILMSGYESLDEDTQKYLNENPFIIPALGALATRGGMGAIGRVAGRVAARTLGKAAGMAAVGAIGKATKTTSKGSTRPTNTKSVASATQKNTPSRANTSGNTSIKTQPNISTTSSTPSIGMQPTISTTGTTKTGSTKGTTGTKGTNKGSNNAKLNKDTLKNIDKEVANSIKKLQNNPEFAKIVQFADIVAKNKK